MGGGCSSRGGIYSDSVSKYGEYFETIKVLDDIESRVSGSKNDNLNICGKLCSQFRFKHQVIQSIFADELSRMAFLVYLRDEYFFDAYYSFEEAVGYLEYELIREINRSKSDGCLNIKRLTAAEYQAKKQKWTSSHHIRYKEIIHELACIAVVNFIKSIQYENFVLSHRVKVPIVPNELLSNERESLNLISSKTLISTISQYGVVSSPVVYPLMSVQSNGDASSEKLVLNCIDKQSSWASSFQSVPENILKSWVSSFADRMCTASFGFLVLTASSNHSIVTVNSAASTIIGSNLLGQSWSNCSLFVPHKGMQTSPELSSKSLKINAVNESISQGIPLISEVTFMSSDSPCLVALHPVSDETGKYLFMLVFLFKFDRKYGPCGIFGHEEFVVNYDICRSFVKNYFCDIVELLPNCV